MTRTEELMQGINTFEDLCKKRGVSPEDILPWKSPINARQMAANDRERLDYIAEYIQDGFVADWGNSDEYKYYPYYWYDKSESAFVFTNTAYYWALTNTNTVVGSRLCFPDRETSDFYGKFTEEIQDRLLANKYPK